MDTILDAPRTNPAVVDQRDMTGKYNTKLNAADEKAFQEWAAKNGRANDTYDYDLRGAFKNGAAQSENGHLPDTYKKPNHPTFSDQSMYHGVDGNVGGTWGRQDGKDTYTPSETNLKNMSPAELQQYFQSVEPDAILNLPTVAE